MLPPGQWWWGSTAGAKEGIERAWGHNWLRPKTESDLHPCQHSQKHMNKHLYSTAQLWQVRKAQHSRYSKEHCLLGTLPTLVDGLPLLLESSVVRCSSDDGRGSMAAYLCNCLQHIINPLLTGSMTGRTWTRPRHVPPQQGVMLQAVTQVDSPGPHGKIG